MQVPLQKRLLQLGKALGFVYSEGGYAPVGALAWALIFILVGVFIPYENSEVFPAQVWPGLAAGFACLWWLASRVESGTRKTPLPSTLLAGCVSLVPLVGLWSLRAGFLHLVDRDERLLLAGLCLSLTLALLSRPFWPRLARIKAKVAGWAVVGAALIFTCLFTWKNWLLFLTFRTGGSSPAAYDQAIWNGVHWFGSNQPFTHFLSSSLCCNSILSDHTYIILAGFLPIYALGGGGPMLLFICQTLAIALTALALYLLGKDRLGPIPAGLVGCAYLFFFMSQRGAAGDFRTDALAGPLILFALYSHSRKRMGWYYILILLAMACKEEIALVIFALGIYLLFFEKAYFTGAATVVCASAWYGLVALVVMPYFGGSTGRFYPYFRQLGDTPVDIIAHIIRQPGILVQQLSSPDRIKYLLMLLAPLGFLPLVGLPGMILALPRLGLNLLSGSPTFTSLIFWYEFTITPFLFFSILIGLEKLGGWMKSRKSEVIGAGAMLVFTGCLFSAQFWGPGVLVELATMRVTDHQALAAEVFQRIPEGASVAAQSNLVTHLAHRQQLWVLPETHSADYILFDTLNPNQGPQPEELRTLLRAIFEDPQYGLVYARDGYFLFQRGGEPAFNLSQLVSAAPSPIQFPCQQLLGKEMLFLGLNLSDTQASAGQAVVIGTIWKNLVPVQKNYLLFTGLATAWQFDYPIDGLYPLMNWQPGSTIQDQRLFYLPVLPDGDDYELVTGFWSGTGPPAVKSPDQLLGENLVRLAKVQVKNGQYKFNVCQPQ